MAVTGVVNPCIFLIWSIFKLPEILSYDLTRPSNEFVNGLFESVTITEFPSIYDICSTTVKSTSPLYEGSNNTGDVVFDK